MKKGFLLGNAKPAKPTGKEPVKPADKEPESAQADKEQTWFFIPSGDQKEQEPAAAQTDLKASAAQVKQEQDAKKLNEPPQKGKKRRRTRTRTLSHGGSPSPLRGFFIPEDGADKTMDVHELMNSSKGLTNMALAHEIAVDRNFRLQKNQPEDPMEQRVQDMMKKAFWDIMEEQIKNDPPKFDNALEVLKDVKNMIFSILLPQHHKLKKSIDEVLDLDLIKQQVNAGALDFKKYAAYILGLMGQLCAPVHDEKIEVLKAMCQQEVANIVALFKGITEVLEEMKLDMANFTIQQARPLIMNQSVEYEKIKFKEFLEKQEDGLAKTREWLIRHGEVDLSVDPKLTKTGTMILNEAYTEILEWDEYYHLPETLVMDEKRIFALRNQVDRVAVSTAVMTMCDALFRVVLQKSNSLKETIKKNVDILLEDFNDDVGLLEILPRVADQVVKDINDHLEKENVTDAEREAVKASSENFIGVIKDMEDPNQRIRDLYQKKIMAFMKEAITVCDPSSGAKPSGPKMPPALMICQKEMYEMAGQFVRLVNYNKSVFGEFYNQIIENHIFFKV